MDNKDTSVKVAVRIRPLSQEESQFEPVYCVNTFPEENQIIAGNDTCFTFDHVFGADTTQAVIFEECVVDLLDAFFEGFNATILAYGQTGSGKTWTMGSSSEVNLSPHTIGIIPRMIRSLFEEVRRRESEDPRHAYKVSVQFLELYGEDIRDLLDQTKTSNVTIRETREDGVFVSGAREELVSSYEQMMKALEDGTAHRTTGSTRMNQTSSRSHAIFTVILEHTIYDYSVADSDNPVGAEAPRSATHQEVRRSKFHFVDLAGSERAKRTGAQGQQLKEGIDINKGLLALGNVISALGDDNKRGKTFVPYRDSKLTRMLQDSLGGNSKTLMICCVSPSSLNFNESVNALRYANRARNIKNKPIVNRDPTLVMIDELRQHLKNISSELLEMRRKKQYIEVENPVSLDVLEQWANTSIGITLSGGLRSPSMVCGTSASTLSFKSAGLNGEILTNDSLNFSSKMREPVLSPMNASKANDRLNKEIATLRSTIRDSDFEIQRLTNQLKQMRQQISENEDSLILANSERDFYKMKWAESSPTEAARLDHETVSANGEDSESADQQNGEKSEQSSEKKRVMDVVAGHLREIESLKKKLAEEQSRNATHLASMNMDIQDMGVMDAEFTTSISSLLNQTREQLRLESQKLKENTNGNTPRDDDETGAFSDEDRNTGHNDETVRSLSDMEDEQKAYLKRQKLLTTEVEELGQSILLKEQLMAQLTRSQQQYGAMKAFYEQKLNALSTEMQQKEEERDRLLQELQEVSGEKTNALVQKEAREQKLREELKRKDEEIRNMKKKQEELNRLSQMQTRYSQQLLKLETEITSMKKQRVDLTKTLNQEKKNHIVALTDKAREIEKLKRELVKSNIEVKKLGRDKELAEIKAKDALREGVELKKKTQELMKATVQVNHNLTSARTAYRAVSKMSRISNLNKRILTEEELRTKKWLDKRIEEISSREAAAEALRAQYEHQLELLNRKESLEQARTLALEKRNASDANGNASNPESFDSSLLLSTEEKEKLLEIEEQLTTIDGELDERHFQISSIAQQIASSGDVAGSDKTMEVLKRTAAGSLPAAHELIRLLFDMLVQSSRNMQLRCEEVSEAREREEQLKQDIENLFDQIAAEKRAHDLELMQSANEYEEKLQDLFEQIAISNYKLFEKDNAVQLEGNDSDVMAKIEPVKLQLAVTSEECKFLRSQLGRESTRYSQLLAKYTDLEKARLRLQRECGDKADQIRFLEDDRSLFKTLADDLKAGLQSMGKQGKVILDSIKDRHHNHKSKRGLFAEYTSLSDNEEDDTESVIGEFEFLAQEIARTGGISMEKVDKRDPAPATPQQSQTSGGSGASASSGNTATTPSRSIYDRLTNPSNFTGHMKNVFENDLELKRKKIQQIKEKSNPQREKKDASSKIGDPPPSKRNLETQKFFSEYYDRSNGTPTAPVSSDMNATLDDTTENSELSSGRSTSAERREASPSQSMKERRESSPSIKRYSLSNYPPKAPSTLPNMAAQPPVEWSISSDPWR